MTIYILDTDHLSLFTSPADVALTTAREIVEQTYREINERQLQLQLLDLLDLDFSQVKNPGSVGSVGRLVLSVKPTA
jgi:hypothetical protein